MLSKKLLVVGTGMMAKIRTKAFLNSSVIKLEEVVSSKIENAKKFANNYGCLKYSNDYEKVNTTGLDIVLIEVPHDVQFRVALWFLDKGLHVLIGGCLARNLQEAEKIIALQERHQLVVETGFEARYKSCWIKAKQLLAKGEIGQLSMVQSVAYWNADVGSWYYNQEKSGGMPITHMTYAFLNPLIWLLGMPKQVSAFSNKIGTQKEGMVSEVSCTANLCFKENIICNISSSYLSTESAATWKILFLGTKGIIEIEPGELDEGILHLYNDDTHEIFDVLENSDAFQSQVNDFLSAVDGNIDNCKNSAQETIKEIKVVEAILLSLKTGKTIAI